MFTKRMFLLLFLVMIAIVSVASVAAVDLGNDTMAAEDNDIIEEITNADNSQQLSDSEANGNDENNLAAASDEDILQASGRPISELQTLIDKTSYGGSVSLRFDYYIDDYDSTVVIDKAITVNGNGHTIDAQQFSRIFNITGNGVVLNDLTLKNGYNHRYLPTSPDSYIENPQCYGGAIMNSGKTTINNCNFYDNIAGDKGGAICSENELIINKCNFYNNLAGTETDYGFGGAVYSYALLNGNNVIISDSIFENNAARAGGAVYLSGTTHYSFGDPYNCIMKNNMFYNNSALFGGGALYTEESADLLNSIFLQNRAGGVGGAICAENTYMVVDNYLRPAPLHLEIHGDSLFMANEAKSGGAICASPMGYAPDFEIKIYGNTVFEQNYANSYGALYIREKPETSITGAKFIDNAANSGCGAMYGGTAIDCIFDGNSNPQTNGTVILSNTKLAVRQSGSKFNDKVITVTLTDAYGLAIANQYVKFNINGKTVQVKTNSKGQASYKVVLPAKTYTAVISFAGKGKYIGTSNKAKIVVKKDTPKIIASKKIFKLKNKVKKYAITLKDGKGKVMKNINVKISVGGKSYSAKTNSKGKATFKINKLNKKGNFQAKIKFTGNGYYNSVTKKVTISVKK